ncbi:PrsW family intramembrane metalloprotease [Mycolicibacterium tusciae]|uniref:PrsW family intramembrane metalloprotease n=1 Tax=Mycolicibacterium tusciae TaxID=75922 RepID=UPI00024A32BD|nr:PrsW family intramembrane metalloprotease [Mycolicibacterium tusciae]
MAYAGAPQQSWPTRPPFERKIRQVGAPLGVLILLGIIAGLIVAGLTALNPVGASIGFVLSGVAIGVVVFAYIWLDRWEPEPPRLLVFAFLWGASVAVIMSVIIGLFVDSLIVPSGSEDVSWVSIAIGAPVIEEAAKGAFLLLMMTGRRRRELNSLTDCLVYAGLVGAGFAWLEDILYIAGGETLGDSLLTAGVRLIMGPFAHSLFTTMFALGVWFALQTRNPVAKAFYLLLGYLGAVIMHGLWNGSSVIGPETYLAVYVFWMVPVFVFAIVLGVRSRKKEQRIVAAKLPGMVAAQLVTPSEATWLNSIKNRKLAIATASRIGGKPAGKAVKAFAAQVVELAFVRDRIDRGFGDDRVYAMQTDEANRVHAARMEAPALQGLVGFQAPPAK